MAAWDVRPQPPYFVLELHAGPLPAHSCRDEVRHSANMEARDLSGSRAVDASTSREASDKICNGAMHAANPGYNCSDRFRHPSPFGRRATANKGSPTPRGGLTLA